MFINPPPLLQQIVQQFSIMQEVNIGHYEDNLCSLGRAVTQVL